MLIALGYEMAIAFLALNRTRRASALIVLPDITDRDNRKALLFGVIPFAPVAG